MATTPKVELRMSAELRTAIDAEAERTGVTRTAWIVNACWAVLAVEAPGGPGQVVTPAVAPPRPRPHRVRPPERPAPVKACGSCGGLGSSHQRGCKVAQR